MYTERTTINIGGVTLAALMSNFIVLNSFYAIFKTFGYPVLKIILIT